MNLSTNPQTTEVFENYPDSVRSQMEKLRELVLDAASEVDGLENLEETLKWGEPSYLTKHGSTVRVDWKVKKPDQYAMYFKCTSKLVPTFKKLYQDTFTFEGDRAIIFKLDEKIPKNELKHCIKLALTYHKVKHLLLLGA
jgi:hemoglobin-like flavoprotein